MKTLPAQNSRQRGGTLTGFVVGLLAGLGIALSVAIYVTRVPVPFVDRGVSRNPAQDAAESARNQGWNPNAGLSSQQAPLPATPPVLPDATATAGPATVPAALGQPAPGAPDAAAAADPLGDLVRSRTGGGTTAAPAATAAAAPAAAVDTRPPEPDSATFFVQAGAFRAVEEAEAQRARLAMLGVAADITEREQGGRPVYRVRVGPFSQKTVADATLQQLGSQGIEAALVRVQR